MAKSEQRARSERPLAVDIPRPGADQPAWSKVGIIAVLGFVVGIAWPRIVGVKVGPAVPADLRAQVEAAPARSASAPVRPRRLRASGSASAGSGERRRRRRLRANQEMVVVGPGKILKCWDKRDKKVDDCESLLIDPIVVKRLRELSRCPHAMGLTGKMAIGFEVDFGKKEVGVKQRKKGTTPALVDGERRPPVRRARLRQRVARRGAPQAQALRPGVPGRLLRPRQAPGERRPPRRRRRRRARPPARRPTRTRPTARRSSPGTPPFSARSPRMATWSPAWCAVRR